MASTSPPCSRSVPAAFCRSGSSATQGAHHMAQKFTNRGCPFLFASSASMSARFISRMSAAAEGVAVAAGEALPPASVVQEAASSARQVMASVRISCRSSCASS